MVALELEGDTLGQKHRGYNAVLKELVTTNASPDSKLADSDLKNLLKIDIASHNKDINYILDILKSDDILYVSRALSSSKWLVTDQEFANIINPQYLESNMYPEMTTKAISKLKKYIRHNIKDESRAEQFYLNEKISSDAIKWLPYCSVQFIENKIATHIKSSEIQPRLFKRLCEKSVSIFEVALANLQSYEKSQYLQIVTFILNTDIEKYLSFLENDNSRYGCSNKLNHRATALIMKHDPDRVINKIEKYINLIHIPTFVKYLTADQMKAFVYAQTKRDFNNYEFMSIKRLFQYDTFKLFIKRLPKNEQFDFVKDILCMGTDIENTSTEILNTDTQSTRLMKLCYKVNSKPYIWYEFAPYELAYEEITKLYRASSDNYEKREMLDVLIKCANKNLQHIQDILKFYNKHTKESSDGKCDMVTKVLEHTDISKYDEKTWNTLNELLISAKIYEADDCNKNAKIVNSIIIYNALHGQKIPEAIEKAFSFDTFKSYKFKMNEEQQNKIFEYLLDYLSSQTKEPVTNEKNFTKNIETLENILKLLRDWDKSFLDFPVILNKIKELIKLKKENSWKPSLSTLYNINKGWRKHMFEESVALCPSEEVCLNALKHDPQLITRHSEDMHALRTDDKVSLIRLLRKLRIYWPQSLAQQWINIYMNTINETSGQKAAVKGVCIMLTQNLLFEFIEKYKPVNAKIDWKQIEENVLNVQRLLAKNMHTARPQPAPEAILLYAKGDYLQFALPSLLAIFYNLKHTLNKIYIPKLLDAPVSLQKHGIRLAFKKLDRDLLKKIFLDCWQSSKNVSIRAIIFKYTFSLLCSEKDDANAVSLWELLELFMDNLTFTEDKDTYQLLSEVDKVPLIVRPKFLIKSYEFLQKLILKVDESSRSNYQWNCATLAEHSRQVMETISPEFVLTIIQEFIEHDFLKSGSKFVRSVNYSDGIITVISAYLLCTTTENDQISRYEQIIVPLMQRSFEKCDEKHDGRFYIRQNFQHLLTRLSLDLKEYVTEKKKIIPVKMFSLIQTELERTLKVSENYLMLTKWKLTVALARLAEKCSSTEILWYDTCGPEFGKLCLEYLKQDVSAHFPCIYVLFSKSVRNLMDGILPTHTMLEFYDSILSDKDFIQGYLAAIEISANYGRQDEYKAIYDQIFSHPSIEVKMHYYNKIDKPKI